MNYQQSPIILSTLCRNEPSNILLADFLLKEAINNQLNLEPGTYDLDDVVWLHIVQTKEDMWLFVFSTEVEEANPKNYKYRVVIGLTIPDIMYLCQHTKERHKLIETLLPIGVKTTSYHDLGKYNRNEFN